MSRLGDMILTERTRRGMSAKQVAKMGGVSEKYILEVEAGSRIIADDAARRLLKAMGKKGEIVSDFEAMSSGDSPPARSVSRPLPTPIEPEPKQISGSWLNAMGGVLHPVPIRDLRGATLSTRMLPIENGKIEGAAPDKVFYLSCPDSSMRGYRIRQGDLLLIVPSASPIDGSTMILSEQGIFTIRRVTRQDGGRVLLQWFDAEPLSRIDLEKNIKWIGRAIRCEFSL